MVKSTYSTTNISNIIKSNRAIAIALALFVCVIVYSLLIAEQISNNAHATYIGTQVVAQYTIAFALMFFIWWRTPDQANKTLIAMITLIGITLRVVLISVEPYTSSDVSRYLFDGRILLTGLDPYVTAHNHPSLDHLRTLWQPPVDHLKYPTVYPPFALALYALAAWFGATFGVSKALLIWKLLTAIASIFVCLVGISVLRHANKPKAIALIALNPLLILEAAEGAHIDVFTTLSVVLATWAWQRRHIKTIGIALGIGASIKIVPAILLLPIWFFLSSNRLRLELAFSAFATWFSIYATAIAYGLKPLGILQTFFIKWRSSSPLFHYLEPSLGSTEMLWLVMVLAISGLSTIAYLSWKNSATQNDDKRYLLFQASLALPFLISPVVFNWYLMPLAFVFALKPNWLFALWIMAFASSYEVLNNYIANNNWQPADWSINLIAFSLILGAILSILSWYFKTNLSKV